MDNIDPLGKQTLESMSQASWYNQWILGKFQKFLKGRILEVGCGIGNFTSTLEGYGQVVAVDINKSYLDFTKKFVKSTTQVGYGDIEKGKYFFHRTTFDAVICLNVLEHIKDDYQALANLNLLLKKGGKLILLVPAHPQLFGPIDKAIGHYRRYDKQKLQEIIKDQGFEVIYCRRVNLLGAIGWWISGKIFHNQTVQIRKIKLFNLFAPFLLPIEDLIESPIGTSLLIIAQK